MASEIYLDIKDGANPVTLSPFGRTLTVEDVEISRIDRTASGRLVKDIIAVKKKIKLSWDMINTANLTILKGYYDLQTELDITTGASVPGGNNKYTVFVSPFNWTRVSSIGEGFWSGVELEFNEV